MGHVFTFGFGNVNIMRLHSQVTMATHSGMYAVFTVKMVTMEELEDSLFEGEGFASDGSLDDGAVGSLGSDGDSGGSSGDDSSDEGKSARPVRGRRGRGRGSRGASRPRQVHK